MYLAALSLGAAFYDSRRINGKTHHPALRALASRWLEIFHHLLLTGQHYDETVYQHHRFKNRPTAA